MFTKETHTSNRAAATLRNIGHGRRGRGATIILLIAPEATASQGDVVGASDSLTAPRHGFCLKSEEGWLVIEQVVKVKESRSQEALPSSEKWQ